MASLTVTIKDNATGDCETQTVADNDYFLITTGSCYEAGIQVYPKSGTHVITIKGQRAGCPSQTAEGLPAPAVPVGTRRRRNAGGA